MTRPTAADSEIVTEAVTEFFPNVQKQDYEGASFRMIGIRDEGIRTYGEDPSAGNVNVLNDTLCEMNVRKGWRRTPPLFGAPVSLP